MRYFSILSLLVVGVLTLACKKEGCTNFAASNYDSSATEDDGSCMFTGCTDPDAENYDSRAESDDGSCLYLGNVYFYTTRTLGVGNAIEVYWQEQYAGRLVYTCKEDFIECDDTPCNVIDLLSVEPGSYPYFCVYGRVGGGQSFIPIDTITNTVLTIGTSQCKTVIID